MSNLTNRITQLSAEQLAFLTQRVEQKSLSIPVQPRGEQLPVSLAQQRLWLIHQMQPDSPLLNVAAAIRLTGPLCRSDLQDSFRILCDRHEPLRTVFTCNAMGEPQQIILATVDLPMPLRDLQDLSHTTQQAEVDRLTQAMVCQPFDLSQGPLMRTTLLKLGPRSHLLLLNIHHIIADGWSLGILSREFARLYAAPPQSRRQTLPSLAVQYADYGIWQRQWLQGSTLSKLQAYWQRQLQGVSQSLELPADHLRPSKPSGWGAREAIALSTELTQRLQALGQQANATLFMTVLAAYLILLYRYTGRTDLLVGTPVANRNRVQTEGLIGALINTLALRVPLNPQWTFRHLLDQVQAVVTAAHDHQDYPFEKLVETLVSERTLSHAPLIQVMFSLQADPNQPFTSGDLTVVPLPVAHPTTPFDLVLDLVVNAQGLHGAFVYNCDLFEPTTVQRWVGHLQAILTDIVDQPDTPIGQLQLLTPQEQQQIQQWNQTDLDYPRLCIHQVFERQVQVRPNAVAMVSDRPMSYGQQATAIAFQNQQLTYQTLNQQANGLAHQLQTYGIGPGQTVGVCLDRSPTLILAILAIWKAGGAYIPLDPTYPPQRLQMMVADTQPQLILTQQTNQPLFPHQPIIDLEAVEWDPQPETPPSQISPEQLAYVIFTSGSTGRPKGVPLAHHGLVSLCEAQPDLFPVDADSQILQFASVNFDASVWEMIVAWGVGATLHLGTSDQLLPGPPLQTFLQQRQITHAILPPTALMRLDPQALPCLHTVITAGEACPADLVRAWRPGRQLFNAYGPTEITIVATVHPIQEDTQPPIGTPLANVTAYILDTQLQPLPIGMPGELCVSGVGLTQGYLNRPGQTAARFIPNPFSKVPGTRLYRTGDLACYRADGTIEFLGRLDHQVKLRGLRIELGEIEAQLRQHPAISQALVTDGLQPNPQLVAYCIMPLETRVTVSELRQFLEQTLLTYMVPGQFVFLDSMPLLPNGKVNRQALPAPDPQLRERQWVAPRNALESSLVKIWQQVLQQEDISIEDHFFERGGHSLLATQLMTQVQAELGVLLPLRQIFETPTIAGLATYLQSQSNAAAAGTIPRYDTLRSEERDRTRSFPLSFAQQRLWFLAQLEATGAAYHVATQLHLQGTLNLPALQHSFEQIVARHDILRTRFVADEGQPRAEIDPPQPLDWGVTDLQQCSPEVQAASLDSLIQHTAQAPFDLAQGPLLRIKLVHLEVDEAILLVTLHHIIADGQSAQIFLQELIVLYQAFVAGQVPQLPTLPIQYVDYAHWQRQLLQDSVLQPQLDYWRQQLTPLPPVLELPCDFPRPAAQTYAGASQQFTLPSSLTHSLRQLAHSTDTTLFMVLLAAFKVLLYRYSGQTDLAVGSPMVYRNHRDLEGLIGLFTNTLVLRTDLAGAPSFRVLLQRVQKMAIAAYAHQDLPFDQLVEELRLPRDLSHSPLFQVMFAHQTAPPALNLPDLSITPVALATETAKFDLTLTITETDDGLAGVWAYNTDLFTPTTMERWIGHFQVLLQGIIDNPDQPIQRLPLLTSAEQNQILSWCQHKSALQPLGDPMLDDPIPVSTVETQPLLLHQRIAAHAQAIPDAIAVTCYPPATNPASLTYQELNQRADDLAAHLQSLGVGPEVIVGLCAPRSPATLVGLLAVLKAGGAYLPIDPTYPCDRIHYLLQNAQVSVLLTHPSIDLIPANPQTHVINLETVWEGDLGDPQTLSLPTPPSPRLDSLAYVIYTSGSTGHPKGVQVHHRALSHYLQWCEHQYPIMQGGSIPVQSSLSFDATITSLWAPLWAGHTITLFPDGDDIEALGTAMQQGYAFGLLKITPAHLDLLNNQLAQTPALYLPKALIIGGEALRSDQVEWWRTHAPETRLINEYGPTETVVGCGNYDVVSTTPHIGDISIGQPIHNMQMYVLNPELALMPIGVIGELYIGGAGVARGYLHQPALTADRFIPNPFSTVAGTRLYRTGDLARYCPDGTLEFIGRADDQIKIRGFRIEPGEIEAILSQHPQLQSVAIVDQATPSGLQQLIAYGVPAAASPLTTAEMRAWLRERLPDYMLPHRLIALAQLPLTSNGKVDRADLRSREVSPATPTLEYVEPRTPTEIQLAQIWSELLGITPIGIQDNFFELGGHSLLATQLVSRIRRQFKVELSLPSIFHTPTIAELVVQLHQTGTSQPPTIPAATDRQQQFPLSFAQERLWLVDQMSSEQSAYNMSATVRLDGRLDHAALEAALNAVIERHESLRTTFPVKQNQPVQEIASDLTLSIPIVDLQGLPSRQQKQEWEQAAIAHAQHSFDLSTGPLLHATLLQLEPKQYMLLLTMHHIITDGWSNGVLIQELSHCYRAVITHQPPSLPPLPIQYADFAQWQRQQDFEPQLHYWRRQLGGDLPTLQLPLDAPRPEVRSPKVGQRPSQQGALFSFPLSPQLSDALQQLSQQESTTLFMTLLAGFKLLLSCHTQQRDIVVGTDVANRNHSEVEGLIGFFVNLLVLRTDLSGNPSFKTLLQRIKTVALAAYNHQDIPFAKLVDVLQPQRQTGVMPLFQVLFVLQNAPMPAIELPDLTLTPIPLDTQTAKFDLALFVQETPESLILHWNYSTDVFQTSTIERLAQQYVDLLQQVVTAPETAIETMTQPSTPKRKRFQRVKTQAVAPTEVVTFSTLANQMGVYQPQVLSVNLAVWASAHRQQLNQQLEQKGALLFRGFDLPDAHAFEQVAGAICPELFGEYGDLPRTGVSGKVYGSTPYPEDRAILFHNESSHLEQWPMKIWFFCVQPAQAGGETPIVDCRQVYQRLSAEVRDRIFQKRLMYERHFVPGLDVDWRDFFQTEDPTAIEQRCQANGVEWTWLENDGLRTRQVRDAIARHPHTQEWVFFNQLQLHHFSYIDADTQASIRSLLGDNCLPRQVYYGDGSEIEPEVLAEINAAYDACAQQFTWQQGDLLMLDNMLMAHGRRAFQGPRKIVVALGEMMRQDQLEQSCIGPPNAGGRVAEDIDKCT